MEPHDSAKPFTPKFIYKINYTLSNRDEICYKSPTPFIITAEEVEDTNYDYLIFNDSRKITTESPKHSIQSGSDYNKFCLVNCMVIWIPDVKNNPGEYFYLKYKVKGEKEYQITEPEMKEDFIILHNFDACKNYEIILTAVDGDYSTDSGILLTPSKVVATG